MNTLGKVIIDQLIGAPIYIYSYYCVTHFGKEWMDRNRNVDMNLQPNKNNSNNKNNNATNTSTSTIELMTETSNRAIDLLPGTMIRHWTIWPAVHTLNFYYNPIHHRVLVQNVVLIFWSGYLSHLNNGGLQLPVQVVANNRSAIHNNDLHLITPEEEVEMTALSPSLLSSGSRSASEQQTTTTTSIKTRITKRIATRSATTNLERRYSSEAPLATPS